MEEMKEKMAAEQPQKMSYEELEGIAKQLDSQCRALYTKVNELNMQNAFQRLGFLFKVIENGPMFSSEFLQNCIKEVEYMITIPEDNTNSETEE